ncbi:hypothetical protein ACFL0Q_02815 [Thermodesulfobacteriota bacterium]
MTRPKLKDFIGTLDFAPELKDAIAQTVRKAVHEAVKEGATTVEEALPRISFEIKAEIAGYFAGMNPERIRKYFEAVDSEVEYLVKGLD